MDCIVGVDIGHSTNGKATTGIVVLESKTQKVRLAAAIPSNEIGCRLSEILEDGDKIVTAVIDGPLAAPQFLEKQRLCERFFSCGVFASTGKECRKLRLQPAPTKAGGRFHVAATRVAEMLKLPPFSVPAFHLCAPIQPSIIEIFPTVFMASLLPPQRYEGIRSAHTDYLWAELLKCNDGKPMPVLQPYEELVQRVESLTSKRAKHEVRAAAICAIAAHAISSHKPLGFIGTNKEQGFLLPGTRDGNGWMNDEFRGLLEHAWNTRPDTRQELQWM